MICQVGGSLRGCSFAARWADTIIDSAAYAGRTLREITDGLIPALQRLGAVRTRYEHTLFRDNLLAF